MYCCFSWGPTFLCVPVQGLVWSDHFLAQHRAVLERVPKTKSILQHTIMRKIMQQKIYIFIKCFYCSERAVPWSSFHEICLFLTKHQYYKVTSLSAENFCKKESSSEMQSSVFIGRLDTCWFWIVTFFHMCISFCCHCFSMRGKYTETEWFSERKEWKRWISCKANRRGVITLGI